MYANNEGNNGNGRDGNGGSNDNVDDAVAVANGNDVGEDFGGDLCMAIGCRHFDNDDGTTTM